MTGEYPPLEGGVGAFTAALARALNQLGHEIHIFTDRRVRPQSDGHRWQALLEPVDIGYAQLHPRGRRWRAGEMARIVDMAIRYELDVVNIQYQAAAYNMRSPAVNWLPWRLKGVTRTAVTFHDLRVPYLFPKAGPLRQLALRFMARQAQAVIATNADDFRILVEWGVEPERLRQIPIGSNVEARPPVAGEVAAARAALGLRPADCLLGYFGFLNPSKGADTLLRALAQLDEQAHLVFVGGRTGASDPDNNEAFFQRLDHQIAQLGLGERVHWTGFLDDAAVSAHLYAADMMVMPYRDGVSLRRGTLMAALAHGRPLITTRPASPVPELRHGQNVWLVAPDDAAGLKEAIVKLAAEPELRRRLGEAAAQLAGSFTWDKIAVQTASFFLEKI